MINDYSFGIVPIKVCPDEKFEVLMIKHAGGHWGFPKGHPEKGECPLETAIRELCEETSLLIDRSLLSKQELTEQYTFKSGDDVILKTVKYFIAKVKNPHEMKLDRREVVEGKWVDVNEAPMYLTFEEAKRVCRETAQILQG